MQLENAANTSVQYRTHLVACTFWDNTQSPSQTYARYEEAAQAVSKRATTANPFHSPKACRIFTLRKPSGSMNLPRSRAGLKAAREVHSAPFTRTAASSQT